MYCISSSMIRLTRLCVATACNSYVGNLNIKVSENNELDSPMFPLALVICLNIKIMP